MLYLVYVLTFLAAILFYAFSPRNDQVNLDAYKAEGFIVSFLAQHQAAKDYMAQWLGFNLTNVGSTFFSLSSDADKFYTFFPYAMDGVDMGDYQGSGDLIHHDPSKMLTTQNSDGSFGFLTTVFCVGENGDLTNCDNSNPANPLQQAYLTTYSMDRPNWWPKKESNRQRRYGSWRNALTRRTSGSYNCGTLRCGQHWDRDKGLCRTAAAAANASGYWCVDNGQTVRLHGSNECAQKVPLSITDALGCQTEGICYDAFFCISRVKQGPESYYVRGLTAFYDGINNQGEGADGARSDGGLRWVDLKRPVGEEAYTFGLGGKEDVNFSTGAVASKDAVIFPDLQIVDPSGVVFRNFTLTILLKGSGDKGTDTKIYLSLCDDSGSQSNLKLLVKSEGDTASVAFQLAGVTIGDSGDIPFTINNSAPDRQDEQHINQRLVSLTLIGDSDQLAIYANAGSTPVATLSRATWEAIPTRANEQATMMLQPHLYVASDAGNTIIYGVRYYQGKSLSVVRKTKNKDGFTPSELEQNFKIDAKRYGISSHPSIKPTF